MAVCMLMYCWKCLSVYTDACAFVWMCVCVFVCLWFYVCGKVLHIGTYWKLQFQANKKAVNYDALNPRATEVFTMHHISVPPSQRFAGPQEKSHVCRVQRSTQKHLAISSPAPIAWQHRTTATHSETGEHDWRVPLKTPDWSRLGWVGSGRWWPAVGRGWRTCRTGCLKTASFWTPVSGTPRPPQRLQGSQPWPC